MRVLIGALLAGALAIASRRVFRISWHPTFPSHNGLSPEGARALAARLATADRVDSSDLDVDFAPSRGSTELFVNGETFFPHVFQDIAGAQSSVHISEFEVRDGDLGHEFASLLKTKRQQGVAVRMIVDRHGSSTVFGSKPLIDELVSAGVQVVQNNAMVLDRDGLVGAQTIDWRFDELMHADHRKLFVIDGHIAWVGSAGVADHFVDGRYHDIFVRLDGEAVSYLQTIFLTSFRFLGGPLPTDDASFDSFYPAPAVSGSTPITVLHNIPQAGHLATTDAMVDLIEHAVSRLDIVCPYTADEAMIDRITNAARRGVKVRFVSPKVSNSWATAGAFEHYVPQLQGAGVEVWLHPRFPHAKAVVADDRALVGSTNMDGWALYRNWELGILVEDATFAETLRRELFDVDISRSVPAEPQTNPLIRAKNGVLAALGPLI